MPHNLHGVRVTNVARQATATVAKSRILVCVFLSQGRRRDFSVCNNFAI